MPRILHIADLHLGWRPRDLDDARASARRERRDGLLAEAARTAIDEQVDLVIVAGDLFETFDPDPALAEHVVAELARLCAAGIEVVTVPGNHDELTYAGSVYRQLAERWPGVLITSPMPAKAATLDLRGARLHVYGLAYVGGVTDVGAATAHLPVPEGEGCHVFVAHGTLVGSGGSIVSAERSLPLDRNALATAGYDYVALGHVHVAGTHRLARSVAVYPGCVGGKGLDDLGSRHWTIVELAPGRAEVRTVPASVQPLRHLTLDVTGLDGAEAVHDAICAAADGDALVRVQLVGALPAPLREGELEARARAAFFHLEVRDATTTVSPALLDAWSAVPTVRGTFVRRMRRRLELASDDVERARITRALLHGVAALEEGR
jgi:DNA repair protein SbcD/Mre11